MSKEPDIEDFSGKPPNPFEILILALIFGMILFIIFKLGIPYIFHLFGY